MKSFLMASLLAVSSLAVADDITPSRHPQAVKINSVKVEVIGHGFPVTQVTAQATFPNKCFVPRNEELVSIVTYSKDFSKLAFTVGAEQEGACPEVYAPVTVTINLGQHTRPNDGTFSRVTVNGVVGK